MTWSDAFEPSRQEPFEIPREDSPRLSEMSILTALPSATALKRDSKGNSMVSIEVGGTLMIVVIDDKAGLVVTLWRER